MFRKRDVFNDTGPVPINDGLCDRVEGFSPAGAYIKNAPLFRMIQKPQIHVDNIIDINKVAFLLAVGHAVTAFKQAGFFMVKHLLVEMKSGTAHTAFVLFSGSVDIKIAKSGNRRFGFR